MIHALAKNKQFFLVFFFLPFHASFKLYAVLRILFLFAHYAVHWMKRTLKHIQIVRNMSCCSF